MRAATVLALLGVLVAPPATAIEVPPDYRQEHYRAAVPETVPGGVTVDGSQARFLRDEAGAVMIDVTPLTLGTVGPLRDQWVVKVPHQTIAGAVWLPNVGLGTLDPRLDAWFAAQLERLSGGNRAYPLVFFCRADCWMSWNAAKRAARLGYGAVHWFPGGTDDWFGDLPPLIDGIPLPLESQ